MGQDSNSNRPTLPEGVESRICKIQFRAAAADSGDQSDRVEMYAAVFGKLSEDLGGFVEIIEAGAFADAIGVSDIRALINHDANRVLARNTAGTLDVKEDETGFWCGFSMPGTTYSDDLKISMSRGDINQCSFAFEVATDGEKWEYLNPPTHDLPTWRRTVTKVKRIYDVSIVTYPAYPDTTAALRSRPAAPGEKREIPPVDDSKADWEAYMTAAAI